MGKDADSDPPALSAGAMLREARENRGLSVFEVAEKLFLTEHYVHALESEDYEKLPGEVYVKGYIKSYALLLDLDEEQVMGAYRRAGHRRGQPVAGGAGKFRPQMDIAAIAGVAGRRFGGSGVVGVSGFRPRGRIPRDRRGEAQRRKTLK